MPRYKDTTINDVYVVQEYLGWQEKKEAGNEYADCTLQEWCGISEEELPPEDIINFYKKFYNTKYSDWDTEHKYGRKAIIDNIAYWRKANQIHNWFVQNVQDGEDDCDYHDEVTKELLEELLETCETVLESCVMTDGTVNNGYTLKDGEWSPILEKGNVVIDSSVAEELLPTCSGFFFGGEDYNEYYVDDIEETIKMIKKVLATTDFEKEAVYYRSSW